MMYNDDLRNNIISEIHGIKMDVCVQEWGSHFQNYCEGKQLPERYFIFRKKFHLRTFHRTEYDNRKNHLL